MAPKFSKISIQLKIYMNVCVVRSTGLDDMGHNDEVLIYRAFTFWVLLRTIIFYVYRYNNSVNTLIRLCCDFIFYIIMKSFHHCIACFYMHLKFLLKFSNPFN
jgi:hypothetical protein